MTALTITFIYCFVFPFMLYAAVEDTARQLRMWSEERAFQRWRRRWPR